MAVEASQPLKLSLEAAADLSASQYKFVKLDANGKAVAVAALTDSPIGVLQNKPSASGQMAEVVVIGVTKLQADAAISIGALIGTSADGQADVKIVGDTGEFVMGRALSAAAAANEVIKAIVNCVTPVDGAAAQ